MGNPKYIFRGRYFKEEEIRLIKELIKGHWSKGRKNISKIICERLDWRQQNGRLKVISCLEALRRMCKLGLVKLPPPNPRGGYRPIKLLSAEDVGFRCPDREITGSVEGLGSLHFELTKDRKREQLWRYLIQTYHYLGYKRVVGRYLKYFVYLGNELVSVIGFADGVYHHHLRDRYLGWDRRKLEEKRHTIVNNVRFLILPWVKVKNLGSKLLGESVKVMTEDWNRLYGYLPIAIETFVDEERFKGTVYKAANWISLGITKGKGRRGLNYFFHGRRRRYYIYLKKRGYS